VEPSKRWSL